MKKRLMLFVSILFAVLLYVPNVHAAEVTADSNKICSVGTEEDLKTAAGKEDCQIITVTTDLTINSEINIEGKSLIVDKNLTIGENGSLVMSGLTTEILTARPGNGNQTNTSILLNASSILTIKGNVEIRDNTENYESVDTTKVMAIQTAQNNGAKTSKVIVEGNLTIENCPRGVGNVIDFSVDGGNVTIDNVKEYATNEVKVNLSNSATFNLTDTKLGSANYATDITTDDTSSIVIDGEVSYIKGELNGNVEVSENATLTVEENTTVREDTVITMDEKSKVSNKTKATITVNVNGKDHVIENGEEYTAPVIAKPEPAPEKKPSEQEKNPKTGDNLMAYVVMASVAVIATLGMGLHLRKVNN